MMASSPSQKCGTERPTSATAVVAWSLGLPRRTAAITPAGMPTRVAKSMLNAASSSVIGSLLTIVCATDSSRWSTPRSPRSASQIQCAYCTGKGRSSMYLCRICASSAGSRFSAPSAIAGSPGIARTPRKTSMLANTRTTTAAPVRLIRKPPIVDPSLLVLRECDADERVRIHRHALQRLVQARARYWVVQVDQRPVGEHDLLRRAVQRLARIFGRGLARVVEDEVETRVRVPAVVLRTSRTDELVDVPVRVDAARPADLERVVRPCVGLAERRHEVG